MKKRINTIKGKYIVQGGDDNTLKDNEIRINSDLTMTERVNGEIVNTSSSGSNQGGGGNSPFSWDWTQIGYTPENVLLQQQFEDDIAYSKSLAETFSPSNPGNPPQHFRSNKKLRFVPMVDTSNVTNMQQMFNGCSSLTIPQLDTSNVTNMQQMFNGCSLLAAIPQLDTSNVTNMNSMFYNCSSLTTIPQLNTSNVTDMRNMFYNCSSLTTISQLDTSNVTNMTDMFYQCSTLTTIPQLDTSNVTDMNSMFNGCTALTTIPQLDTSNVTNIRNMFYCCSSLTTIPQLNTSNVTDMRNMFYNCSSLTTISQLDMSNAASVSGIFSNCSELTFALIKSIGKSTLTTYDFTGATNWGTGSDENRQSLIDSLITYSYDRVTNGMASAKIKLSTNTKALLTEDEIAQITAKGFTIS